MLFYDDKWNVLEDPDLEIGIVEQKTREIYHKYHLESSGSWHEEVVAEYPNGGRDVEIVYDEDPIGHWETYDKNTNDKIDFDFVNNGWPEEDGYIVEDLQIGDIYRLLTPDELLDRQKKNKEFELEQKRQNDRQEILDDLPELLCTLYEQSLSQQETIDNQNEILCLMYEKMLEGGE